MSNFRDEYLRILTPRTTDGVNLRYGPDKQPTYKESHAPITALKAFEKENAIRPDQLKHIIERVGGPEVEIGELPKAPPARPQRVPRANPKPTINQ
jgi:hypothetical protein